MKVALVVLEDFPGSENRVQRQALALMRAGHEVRIFCARGRSSERDWEGAGIQRSLVGHRKAASIARRFWEYLAFCVEATIWCAVVAISWRPNVVQFASMPDWLVFSGLPARMVGAVLVLDLHELMPELIDVKGGGAAMRRGLEIAERWSVRFADSVLVPTSMCAETIESRVDGLSVTVVANGVDVSRFPQGSKVKLMPGTLRLGYLGTVAERFGVDTVVEALAHLRSVDAYADLTLTVVGDGDSRSGLEERVASLGLGDCVIFLGQQPAQDVPRLMESVDVGLVPYHDSVNSRLAYPTKSFEYAAMGIPMICSDLPSIRALFSDDEVVYAVPGDPQSWAEAILRVSRMGDTLSIMAAAARQRTLTEHSWDCWAPTYVSEIERAARDCCQ